MATAKKPKADAGAPVHMVWTQPGHHHFGIGAVIRVGENNAEALRAAGHARPANDGEIEAAGEDVHDLMDA